MELVVILGDHVFVRVVILDQFVTIVIQRLIFERVQPHRGYVT